MKPLARRVQHGNARLTLMAATGLTAVFGAAAVLSGPASASVSSVASTVSVTFKIKVSASSLSDTVSGAVSLTATAPATVAPGGAVAVTISGTKFSIPGSIDGVTIVNIKNVKMKLKVPANSTYVSCAISGGSGLGTGKPTCSESGGTVTFTAPGPVKGGTSVTPPKMTVHLKAGTSGTIQSKLAGTSYTSPCVSGTANLNFLGAITAKAVGYPSPSPVLTTTKIT
jgi:dehydratase